MGVKVEVKMEVKMDKCLCIVLCATHNFLFYFHRRLTFFYFPLLFYFIITKMPLKRENSKFKTPPQCFPHRGMGDTD